MDEAERAAGDGGDPACWLRRVCPACGRLADEVAFHRQVLEEDLGLMGVLGSAGLPLDVREELHVPADRLGVALRRALCDFTRGDVTTAKRVRTAA